MSKNRGPVQKSADFLLMLRKVFAMVGLTGLEPVTPALSRRCSNQLSYRPDTILGG